MKTTTEVILWVGAAVAAFAIFEVKLVNEASSIAGGLAGSFTGYDDDSTGDTDDGSND